MIKNNRNPKNLILFLSFLFLLTSCSPTNFLYDSKVKKLLEKENISFEIDKDGDFKILFPLRLEDRDELVWENIWIISHLKEYKDLKVREIFGLVINLPENTSSNLLESLMMDSYNNRFIGSWVVIQKEGRSNFLAYLVKLSLGDLNKNNISSLLEEIAYSVFSMREVLLTSQEKGKKEEIITHQEKENYSYDYYSWAQGEEYYPPAFENPKDIN